MLLFAKILFPLDDPPSMEHTILMRRTQNQWQNKGKVLWLTSMILLGLALVIFVVAYSSALGVPSTPVRNMEQKPLISSDPVKHAIPTSVNESNRKIYKNDTYSFELQYPNNFVFYDSESHTIDQSDQFGKGGIILGSIGLPESTYVGTNLSEAFLTMTVNETIITPSTCQEYLRSNDEISTMNDIQVINGARFYKGESSGAALGTTVKTKIYRVFHNRKCYEVSLNLFTRNIENFDPRMGVKEINENEVWSKLETILFTFKFIN